MIILIDSFFRFGKAALLTFYFTLVNFMLEYTVLRFIAQILIIIDIILF